VVDNKVVDTRTRRDMDINNKEDKMKDIKEEKVKEANPKKMYSMMLRTFLHSKMHENLDIKNIRRVKC